MDVRIIYRTCPACGRRFGQPDDPGRKRRFYCDACNKPPTEPASTPASRPASEPRTTHGASGRSRPAVPGAAGRPMPAAAATAPTAGPAAATAGHTPPTTTRPAHDRARRRYDGLYAKADSTGFPERPPPAGPRPSNSGPSTACR
jgi:hypothetical protein